MARPERPTPRSTSTMHPIRVAARLAGLSVDTLRAWERRHAAVRPARGARGRAYSDADVARLQVLGALVRRGHAIGSVAGLGDADLRRLITRSTTTAIDQAPSTPLASIQTIATALDRYDLEAVERSLNTFAVLLPPRDLIFTIVLPLLRDVGDRWSRGALRPSQEHLISAIVRSVLGGLLRSLTRPEAVAHVVFAAPAGERHELGLLSAALLTASSGAGVVYLGSDLPAGDIAHAAAATDARLVVLALTARDVVPQAERRAIARLSRDRVVWAGGAEASRVADVGGSRVHVIDDLAAFVPRVNDLVR
jgi:DNA-binding transcriptional MerR regulator